MSTIVTPSVYVPALLNVATVDLAAFVPLGPNKTGAGGVPMADHVYFSAPSPRIDAPNADSVDVVAVTVAGLAAAAVETVGGK